MALFAYAARDAHGATQNGTADASNAATLAAELRGRGWLVFDLRPTASAAGGAASDASRVAALPFRGPRKLDVETALRQLALMERAGLPLLQALRTASKNARRAAMGRVLAQMAGRIEAGSSFTEALAEHPRQFPPLVVETIRAGEQSGALDTALTRSAEQMERDRELRASVLQALFYPALVLSLALAVASFLVLEVVPVLEGFLKSSGKRLPWITQALVDTSVFLRLHVPEIAIGLVFGVLVLWALDRYPPTQRALDRLLYSLPFVGRVRRLAGTARFSRSLATLLSNGIDLVRGLNLCVGILTRPTPAEAIARARERVLAGQSLASGLEGALAFDSILPRMVDVGERSGTLDVILAEVASFHEAELRTWVRRASAWIEPITTIVVGSIVGFVYIAFFVALFSAAGAVR